MEGEGRSARKKDMQTTPYGRCRTVRGYRTLQDTIAGSGNPDERGYIMCADIEV